MRQAFAVTGHGVVAPPLESGLLQLHLQTRTKLRSGGKWCFRLESNQRTRIFSPLLYQLSYRNIEAVRET